MGIIIKKRKLSPSGTEARIVENEDGSRTGEIVNATGQRCTFSSGGLQRLQGLLFAAMVSVVAKPPVRRRLDFEHHIDVEINDDDEEFQCGQRSPLISLEGALNGGGCAMGGWLTSRAPRDIKWMSPSDCIQCQDEMETCDVIYLGITFAAEGYTEMSPNTYDAIKTPEMDMLTRLPHEVLEIIINMLPIESAVSLSATCKTMNRLIDNGDFWRHRLFMDLRCVSLSGDRQSGDNRCVYKETYKLVYWSENSKDAPYEEMGILV